MALEPLFPAEENNEVSWYTSGLAGIASYLGRLYRITHDPIFLTTAEGALEFLINARIDAGTEGQGWAENFGDEFISTRWSKGSPGIGVVMLEFYKLTGNVDYLDAALDLFIIDNSANLLAKSLRYVPTSNSISPANSLLIS